MKLKVFSSGLVMLLLWSGGVQAQTPVPAREADHVNSISWNPDGSLLAIARQNGHTEIYNLEDEMILRLHSDLSGATYHLAWSPDGTKIATGGYDQVVRIWDARVGELLYSLHGHEQIIFKLAWSPDSTKLISLDIYGKPNNFRIWDATQGKLLLILDAGDFLYNAQWHPDGEQIITTLALSIQVWDAQTGQLSQTILAHRNEAGTMDLTSDGSKLATGATDGEIIVWNTLNWQKLSQFPSSFSPNQIIWHPDEILLASASQDRNISVWDTETGEQILSLETAKAVYTLAFTPYGGRLLFGGHPSENEPVIGQVFANGAVYIVVPDPSLELLESVREACIATMQHPENLPELPVQTGIPTFIQEIRQLQEQAAIPPGCAADLIAVAEALQVP